MCIASLNSNSPSQITITLHLEKRDHRLFPCQIVQPHTDEMLQFVFNEIKRTQFYICISSNNIYIILATTVLKIITLMNTFESM